jgi:glutamine cyclotransferase
MVRAPNSVLAGLVAVAAGACAADGQDSGLRTGARSYGYEVVNRYPHDAGAYTQGLLYHAGRLYESTGLVGESSVREVELETGRVLRRHDLEGDHFGEGLALVGDRLYQLTWRSGIAFVYDLATFAVLDTLRYDGEGWGLAWDGQSLIMSDGTATLRFLDPGDFTVLRTVEVRDGGAPLTNINELAWIEGELWANVYPTEYIVRIDPSSGQVVGWVDLRGILSARDRTGGEDVLNGIAYDPATRRIFVTGKRWPYLFEITVHPRR